jgi:starch synthase (maltosyl-transferring)
MRIDLITTELSVGGAERCLTEVALAISRAGGRVRVVSLMPEPSAERSDLVERLARERVPVVFLNACRWMDAPRVIRRLDGLLRDDRPEVVQTFLFHANALALRRAQAHGVSVTVGGLRVADPSRWRIWCERGPLRAASAVIAVSHDVAVWAEQRMGLASERVVVIPNGIDLDRWQGIVPQDWASVGLKPDLKMALWVGRLEPQKGVDWLCAAAKPLLDAFPNLGLAIVGDGSCRAAVETHCRNLPAGRCAVLGWRADVDRWLKAAHLLLSTSRYEGMPNALLEAIAAGLPIVATPAQGVRELLAGPGEAGLVPFGDTPGLLLRVGQVLGNEPWIGLSLQQQKRRIEETYSLAAMTQAYEQTYGRLLGRSSPSPKGSSDLFFMS